MAREDAIRIMADAARKVAAVHLNRPSTRWTFSRSSAASA